jgi:Fe-S-cluster containining protein
LNDALEELRAFHDDVDASVQELAEAHGERLQCKRGCAECCIDGVTVFEVEAERIRREHPELLLQGRPHPSGACAFLDEEGACRIYASRPYVCRTQGLPLRWIDEDPDTGEPAEFRDICVLNEEGGDPLPILGQEKCWTIGPHEDRLRGIQEKSGTLKRVALRTLFAQP